MWRVRSSSLSLRVRLVLADDVRLVLVDREAAGDAGLLVLAHPQSVDVQARVRLLDERGRRAQPGEVAARPSRRPRPRADPCRPAGRSRGARRAGSSAGSPSARARASATFTTSYGTAATAEACAGCGRRARKGWIVATVTSVRAGIGTAYRIRTDDLRLERAVSWASRRMRRRGSPMIPEERRASPAPARQPPTGGWRRGSCGPRRRPAGSCSRRRSGRSASARRTARTRHPATRRDAPSRPR